MRADFSLKDTQQNLDESIIVIHHQSSIVNQPITHPGKLQDKTQQNLDDRKI